jgi:hypothetical protein
MLEEAELVDCCRSSTMKKLRLLNPRNNGEAVASNAELG